MIKSDKERLLKIKRHCEKLTKAVADNYFTKDKILDDELTQWAITTPLFNIGEHVSHLSTELKEKYSDVPWKNISALRNRIVHSYEDINWNLIVEVVFSDIPVFNADVDKILNDLTEDENNGRTGAHP